ncbi:MAG TPA: hypothetical protein VG322_04010 [Candidatus Acidoferrales bacterium]|jgi:hypothetical protein|nr:hypothetical protein [Candidatus Acidoferrales bacterium]
MATTVAAHSRTSSASEAYVAAPEISSVPWYIWVLFAAVVSVVVGGYWDISWHMSIGRDTFWTPAHIAIQMCGILAGISCGYLIFSTTFGNDPALRAASVEVWKFRGPLGAFIACWGGATMLSSAPFDNWWHNAYGLDVKIFSPPHVVLDGGVLAIQVGAVVLIASTMNRSSAALAQKLDRLLLLLGGMVTMLALTVVWESTYRVLMHSASCYRAIAIVLPVVLLGFAAVSRQRWACTIVAAIYMSYAMFMLWLFPLFPATPKLGPVYQHITHMVPMEFPLLIIVPALALDLVRPRIAAFNKWAQAAILGLLCLASLLAVQWPFASFLISPASANWFFGTKYFAYFARPNGFDVRHLFFPAERTAGEFYLVLAEAFTLAILSSRLGMAWGEWVRKVRR